MLFLLLLVGCVQVSRLCVCVYIYTYIFYSSSRNRSGLRFYFVVLTGIDVNAHDIRFVEDNWESPVRLFFLLINFPIYAHIMFHEQYISFVLHFLCAYFLVQANFQLFVWIALMMPFATWIKAVLLNVLLTWTTSRCLVPGDWAGRFGWMGWKSHNSPTSSRLVSLFWQKVYCSFRVLFFPTRTSLKFFICFWLLMTYKNLSFCFSILFFFYFWAHTVI